MFLDNFIKYRNDGKIIELKDCYKDFITIDYFNKVIAKIIKKNITGIYNLSLGKKVYLSEIIMWLDVKFSKNVKFNSKRDGENSFTLNNKKLVKKIKISISKKQVMNFCRKIFK